MTTVVRTNALADEEIFRYVAQYAAESTALGERLWSEIQSTFRQLSDYPESGPVDARSSPRYRTTHSAAALPFFIVYRVMSDHVEVMALAHMSRRPNYWRSRFS